MNNLSQPLLHSADASVNGVSLPAWVVSVRDNMEEKKEEFPHGSGAGVGYGLVQPGVISAGRNVSLNNSGRRPPIIVHTRAISLAGAKGGADSGAVAVKTPVANGSNVPPARIPHVSPPSPLGLSRVEVDDVVPWAVAPQEEKKAVDATQAKPRARNMLSSPLGGDSLTGCTPLNLARVVGDLHPVVSNVVVAPVPRLRPKTGDPQHVKPSVPKSEDKAQEVELTPSTGWTASTRTFNKNVPEPLRAFYKLIMAVDRIAVMDIPKWMPHLTTFDIIDNFLMETDDTQSIVFAKKPETARTVFAEGRATCVIAPAGIRTDARIVASHRGYDIYDLGRKGYTFAWEGYQKLILPALSNAEKSRIQNAYRDQEFWFTNESKMHPYARSVRLIEQACVERIIMAHKAGPYVDIYGSSRLPNDHKWVKSPKKTGKDLFRKLGPRSCEHEYECMCVTPAFGLLVDAIYYLSKADLVQHLRSTSKRCIYALFHDMRAPKGETMDGEYTWVTEKDTGKKVVSVGGAQSIYAHEYPDWLFQQRFTVPLDGAVYTVDGTYIRHNEQYVTYQYTIFSVTHSTKVAHTRDDNVPGHVTFKEHGHIRRIDCITKLDHECLAISGLYALMSFTPSAPEVVCRADPGWLDLIGVTDTPTELVRNGKLVLFQGVALNRKLFETMQDEANNARTFTDAYLAKVMQQASKNMPQMDRSFSLSRNHEYQFVLTTLNTRTKAGAWRHFMWNRRDRTIEARCFNWAWKSLFGFLIALLAVLTMVALPWLISTVRALGKDVGHTLWKDAHSYKHRMSDAHDVITFIMVCVIMLGTLVWILWDRRRIRIARREKLWSSTCDPVVLPEIDKEWSFKISRTGHGCETIKSTKMTVAGPVIDPGNVIVPHSCLQSNMRALIGRQMRKHDESKIDVNFLTHCETIAWDLFTDEFKSGDVKLYTTEEYVAERTNWAKGKKNTMLAMDKTLEPKMSRHATRRTSFIKEEFSLRRENKPFFERFIQAGSAEYLGVLGPSVYSVAKQVVKTWNGITSPFYYACDDQDSIAKVVQAATESGCTHVVESDFSKFDSHQHLAFLRWEQRCYKHILGHKLLNPVSLALDSQLVTKGVVVGRSDGSLIKYQGKGRRRSGDPNTSLGNTVNNFLAQISVLVRGIEKLKLGDAGDIIKGWVQTKRFVFALLGDDNLALLHPDVYAAYEAGREAFDLIGLPATHTLHRTRLCDAVFLQKRFVKTVDGLGMAPQPGRIFATTFCKFTGGPTSMLDRAQECAAICKGLLRYWPNTPVITALLLKRLDLANVQVERLATVQSRACIANKRRHMARKLYHWRTTTASRLSDAGLADWRAYHNLSASLEIQLLKEIAQTTSFLAPLPNKWWFELLNL